MPLPIVAIVGRPNVGKSTLFNRLVGAQRAVVHDRPGVTRDRLYHETCLLRRDIVLIDTGGIEPAPDTELLHAMRNAAMVAVEEADVIVFVVDGRAGMTPADAEVADLLRRADTSVVLAVNKVDGHALDALSAEFWSIGIQPMHTVSATHGRGIYELLEEIEGQLPEPTADEYDNHEETPDELRIAVIGRPNIGKSTLINRLLGEERHLVHDAPGTTMDPVDSRITVNDRNYVLVDTAGVRKKRKISDPLEQFVSLRAIRNIERCHVCLLVIDGTIGPTDQDARLAGLVEDRGRGLIILVNKWDLVKDLEDVNSQSIEDQMENKLIHASWAPHLFMSALTGKACNKIFPLVEEVFKECNKRISTSELNRWLLATVDAHTPPQRHHRPVRLYYATQTRVRPPTFAIFSNTPEGIKSPYKRYLMNRLRDAYDFGGAPIRIHMKRRRKLGEGEEGS